MTSAPVTLPRPVLGAPSPSLTSLVPSLLPCHIAYDGPANINAYFQPRPHAPADVRDVPEGTVEAAFRGRLLVGSPLKLPDGYSGLICDVAKPRMAESNMEQETGKVVKKAKISSTIVAKKVVAAIVPKKLGTRTSPRRAPPRRVAVQKKRFALDSDSDEDAAQDEPPVPKEEDVGMETDDAVEVPVVATSLSITTTTTVTRALSTTTSLASMPETPLSPPPAQAGTSTYFPPSPSKSTAIDSQETTQVEAEALTDTQKITPLYTFDELLVYQPDWRTDLGEDLYAKALGEWPGVAALIHAY